jgi:hypothetical protein
MSTPRTSDRGFAMPLVVVLALFVSIMVAIVIGRQSSQGLIVERQIRTYKQSHFERGLREVVGAWTDSLLGQPLRELIGEDGHTLDIEMNDGGWASVYLFDGQGSLVSTSAGLTEQQRADMAGVIEALAAITGDHVDPSWFRPVGPVKVSLMTAEPEVLEAIAAHAGSRTPERMAASILEARARGELLQPDVETAYNAAGLGPEQRTVANRLVALQPELWAMVVEVYDPQRIGEHGPLQARYLGRFTLPVSGGARAMVSLNALGKFLSWEELPLD